MVYNCSLQAPNKSCPSCGDRNPDTNTDGANDGTEVAQAMGVACCLIPSGNHTAEKLKRCGVPVVESLEQIAV